MLGAEASDLCCDRPEDVRANVKGQYGRAPAEQFRLRRAVRGDYPFAEKLYVATMRPLLEELGAWDESEILRRFRGAFRLRDGRVILVGSHQAGWFQVRATKEQVVLVQIHLASDYRGRGIGSSLVRCLLAEAARRAKPVVLNCLVNNPACRLYRLLGFEVVRRDGHKLLMRWKPVGLGG
jgi:ribosomal protein S18 acetylase RimI-like enzyme